MNSRTFRGTRVRFGLPLRVARTRMEGDAQDTPRRSDRVTVVYSPSLPSVSALRRGAHPFVMFPLIVGAGLLWVGLMALR